MPEGHSIARYAAQHRELLVGSQVAVTSPQGRFARGASRLDDRELTGIDTHGKHLFYRWRRAESLHVHLGLYGKFTTFHGAPPPPTQGTRLAMQADGVTIYLAGPTTCELVTPSAEERIRSRLGPDPLQSGRRGHSAAEFVGKLSRRSIPLGAAIIDQAVLAGLGNIYRSEVLFLTGLNPNTVANQVPEDKAVEIWDTSVALLRRGVKEGVIRTVPRSRIAGNQRLFVYKRDRYPCRRCGGPISTGTMADRSIWWCQSCQSTDHGS